MTSKGTHVKVLFMHDAFDDEGIEGAWALQFEEHFVLDNILFYAKNYSFGDVFAAEEVHGVLHARELIEESGHSTVRILFKDKDQVELVCQELEKLGCSYEGSNIARLVSVDIPREIIYSDIRGYLKDGEELGKWEYEEACISSHHRAQNSLG